MSFRQSLACNVSPIFLRLIIGVTFIMAGAGKAFVSFVEVNESNSAALVAMGAITQAEAEALGLPLPTDPPAAGPTATPAQPSDESAPADDPDTGVGSLRDRVLPTPTDSAGNPASDPADPAADQPADQPTDPTDPTDAPPADPAAEPTDDPMADPTEPPLASASFNNGFDPTVPTIHLAQAAASPATPATGPITLRGLHGIALVLYNGANPGTNEDGSQKMALVPAFAAQGSMPVTIAWVTALTELVAGVFLILGLLTRMSGLAVVGIMAGAAWLTVIGPAIQSGTAVLGFLPDTPWYAVTEWKTFLWQLALLAGGLSLLFTGAGSLSLDRLLFGPMGKNGSSDD